MNRAFDVAVAIVGVAAILVLTRPGSQGAQVIKSIGDAFSGALGTATGGGSYNAPQRVQQKRRRTNR